MDHQNLSPFAEEILGLYSERGASNPNTSAINYAKIALPNDKRFNIGDLVIAQLQTENYDDFRIITGLYLGKVSDDCVVVGDSNMVRHQCYTVSLKPANLFIFGEASYNELLQTHGVPHPFNAKKKA